MFLLQGTIGKLSSKETSIRAKEWLGTLFDHPEDQSLVPSIQVKLFTTTCGSWSRGFETLFCSLVMCSSSRHASTNTYLPTYTHLQIKMKSWNVSSRRQIRRKHTSLTRTDVCVIEAWKLFAEKPPLCPLENVGLSSVRYWMNRNLIVQLCNIRVSCFDNLHQRMTQTIHLYFLYSVIWETNIRVPVGPSSWLKSFAWSTQTHLFAVPSEGGGQGELAHFLTSYTGH